MESISKYRRFIDCSVCGDHLHQSKFNKSEHESSTPVCNKCRFDNAPNAASFLESKRVDDLVEIIAGLECLITPDTPQNEVEQIVYAMNDLTDQLLYPTYVPKPISYTITMKEGILSISDIKYK